MPRRTLDLQGEYHSNCPLDQRWLNFAEIHYDDFRLLVASGATDDEIAEWIEKNAKKGRVPRSLHGTTRNVTCV